jgi:pimeloyl-ACP methyl ester carboxylesterase
MPASQSRSPGLHPYRGELVQIGGRALRLVRAGPSSSSRPLVVLESGAFGCAADWAVVQEKLSGLGLRSIAYDRAGLGYSDAGPLPRDGRAIAQDLDALLAKIGEPGPYLLVGHSMGGLLIKVFADRNRAQVMGVVLVDAVTPEVMDAKGLAAGVHAFRGAMRVVSLSAHAGYMRPASAVFGDRIGLTGEASDEKRRIFGLATHAVGAAEEVQRWPETSDLAAAGGPFDPELPVAVVTAGDERITPGLKAIQVGPAKASKHGYVDHVAGANHANLLGKRFGDPIVRGIEHVLTAAKA